MNSFRWLAPLLSRRKHGPISKMPKGLRPVAVEAPQQRVQVRRQHGSQAAAVLEPEHLLAQRVAVLDAHLAQRVGGDDERRDDPHEPGAVSASLSTRSSSTSWGARLPARSSLQALAGRP